MKVKVLIVLTAILLVAGLGMAEEQEGLSVSEGVICTNVENLAPEGAGTSFSADVGKLCCFTRIVGAKEDIMIKHLWYNGDNLLATVELNVKSANWRTYSSKAIEASRKGAWKVEVQGPDGSVLKTLNFTIE